MSLLAAGIIAGVSALGSVAGGIINRNATRKANVQSYQQQRALNEQMHNLNSFQQLKNDARAAGLNPYLATQGATGQSSPSSAPAVTPEGQVGQSIIASVQNFASVFKTMSESDNIQAKTEGQRTENAYAQNTNGDRAEILKYQAQMDAKRDYMLGIDKDYHSLFAANQYAYSEYQNATQRNMALNLGLEYRYNSMYGDKKHRLELDNMRSLYDKNLSDIELNNVTLDEVKSRTHLNDVQARQMIEMMPFLKAESKSRAFAAVCAGRLSNSYTSLNDFQLDYSKQTRNIDVQRKRNELYDSYWVGKTRKEQSLQEKYKREHQDVTYWHNQVSQGIQDLSVINSGVQSWFTFGLGQERQNTYQQNADTYRFDVNNRHSPEQTEYYGSDGKRKGYIYRHK